MGREEILPGALVGAVIGLQLINGSRRLLFLFNAGHGVTPLWKAAAEKTAAAGRTAARRTG